MVVTMERPFNQEEVYFEHKGQYETGSRTYRNSWRCIKKQVYWPEKTSKMNYYGGKIKKHIFYPYTEIINLFFYF